MTRYARQAILPEIGEQGQRRLRAAHAVIVGVGGIGSVSAELLARAGVGRLTLIDFDLVEESNLGRQALYTTADIGEPKAEAAKRRIAAINPDVVVTAVVDHLERGSLPLLDGCDIVVDGTDNMETRFLINERCRGELPVIFSSAVMDRGSVLPVVRGGACYACLFRTKRNGESCCEHGVINGAVHLAGTVAATEAIKLLVGVRPMAGLFSFSLFDARFAVLTTRRDPACPVCGEKGGKAGKSGAKRTERKREEK